MGDRLPFQTLKWLKKRGDLMCRNTYPPVTNRDNHFSALTICLPDLQFYQTAARRIFDGIVKQIQQHLLQTPCVGLDRRQARWKSALQTIVARRNLLRAQSPKFNHSLAQGLEVHSTEA